MLDRHHTVRNNKIRFCLCTGSYWINGHVTTNHRRLVDVLNTERNRPILAEGISVRNCPGTNGGSEKFDYAYVNTSTVLFATPIEEPRDSLETRDTLVWVNKRPERTRFAIGPFGIVGDVYLIEEAKLDASFLASRDQFAVVTNAVIGKVDDPKFMEERDIILVNRERIDYIVAASASV